MKILYIITQADGGGAQKYTLCLAKHFNGAIAAGSEDSRLFTVAEMAGLQTFPLTHLKRNIIPWHDFLAAWEIRQLIKLYRPDIVHLNSSKAGFLGSFAAVGLKTKVVFTAHGFIFNEPLSSAKKAFYLALEKTASAYRDFIITVSDADKKSAFDNNLISQNKIQNIHNGIGKIDFLEKPEALRSLGLANDKIIIGCIANAYKTKGLDVLIDAISILDKEIREKIQVVIIGDGPEMENLKLMISAGGGSASGGEYLRLQETIKLLGKIDNAAGYLKAFDIFILPSRKEGFPYTLLEAMQAGLPIIASNAGGNLEAVGDAGILIASENPNQLCDAITRLVTDKNLREALSKKTLGRAKLFSEQKMLGQTDLVYKKLLTVA